LVVCLEIAAALEYVPGEEATDLIGEYEVPGKQLNRLIQRWE
jgi:hypothetical protein